MALDPRKSLTALDQNILTFLAFKECQASVQEISSFVNLQPSIVSDYIKSFDGKGMVSLQEDTVKMDDELYMKYQI